MAQRLARSAIVLTMTVVGVLLALFVAYFLRGSLEEFPTAEQENKVHTVTAVAAAMLLLVEIGLWSMLRRMRRESPSPSSTSPGVDDGR